MSTVRQEFGLAAVRGKLFAVGGYDGSDRQATAEAFDPQTNRWEAAAPMSGPRCAPAAVAL